MKEIRLPVQAVFGHGCIAYASIRVPEDYTMNDIIRECQSRGFTRFRLTDTMRVFVDVPKEVI